LALIGRWDSLDDSPGKPWSIVPEVASNSFEPFTTEPWQLAVNGIY